MLALDEPTNHLDARTRSLIAQALASFKGIGLLISHDRVLLDALVESCVFMEAGRATTIPGSVERELVGAVIGMGEMMGGNVQGRWKGFRYRFMFLVSFERRSDGEKTSAAM